MRYPYSMKFFILLSFMWNALAFCQEGINGHFSEAQKSVKSPLRIPISINANGKIALIGAGNSGLSLSPVVQLGLSRKNIKYSHPIKLNHFNFYQIQEELGGIEIKTHKWELGLGLAAAIGSSSMLGLSPYKGSFHTIVRQIFEQGEDSRPPHLPQELGELTFWHNGDVGTFQTYGGIQAFAKMGIAGLDLAGVTFSLQNKFIIEIRKMLKSEIIISISEENIKKRNLRLGPMVSKANLSQFQGKQFKAEFKLNPLKPEHHLLFKEILSGHLFKLQAALPQELQKIFWAGWDYHLYAGIPFLVGKTKSRVHLDINEEGVETALDISGTANNGYLRPLRTLRNYAYQTEEDMVIVWSSEMSKVNVKAIDKSFLSTGRIIGIKGFESDLPHDNKLGSMMTQIGLNFSKKEAEKLRKTDLNALSSILKERCLQENLSCKQDTNLRKIVNHLSGLIKKPWKEMRGEFGLLMIKEPALVYSILKVMKLKKEAYFKFLSQKYQSLEGSAPIVI